MGQRSILAGLAVGLFAATACTETTTDLVEPEATAHAAYGVQTDLEVRYYHPSCTNLARDHGAGEWSFPAGSGACLVARVVPPGNAPPTGYVLWQMCGVPGNIGPKEDCDAGDRNWGPRTGEVWSPVNASGEYTTESHTTSCNGSSFTRGYRYLYSRQHPDDPPGGGVIVTSEAINVTSDGVNC